MKHDEEKKIFKSFLKKKKKILVWGIGTNLFKFISNINLRNKRNIYYTDVREHGKKIFDLNIDDPINFFKKEFDLLVISTAEVENVKKNLKKLNIKYKKLILIKS